MKAGTTTFPPVVLFVDPKGVHHLADGYHRCAAAEAAGLTEIAAEVRQGTRKDALLYAVGANASHGLKRTNADRRKAVMLLLADASWGKRSDNWIAKQANVSQPFVSKLRATSNVISDPVRETADGRMVDTTEIGKDSGEPTPDARVERLSKALQRLLSQWPTERRADLQKLVDSTVGAAKP
jgi:hypothetical protein